MNKIIILATFIASLSATASDLSHKAKERIADILMSISEHKEVQIDKKGTLKIFIEEKTLDVNSDLLKELKESGVLDDKIMAKESGKCTKY